MTTDLPNSQPKTLLCPSAQPDWDGAVTFGVVAGTAQAPQIVYLKELLEPNPNLLALTEPVRPTEVFRFAAACKCSGCRHFEHTQCSLATKLVTLLTPVVDELPACGIRDRCRWFFQEGGAACRRCPQVVTDNTNASEPMRIVADPSVRPEQASLRG
jgi:hypothetical protein